MKYPNRKCDKCNHMTPRWGKWCSKHVPKTFEGVLTQSYQKLLVAELTAEPLFPFGKLNR